MFRKCTGRAALEMLSVVIHIKGGRNDDILIEISKYEQDSQSTLESGNWKNKMILFCSLSFSVKLQSFNNLNSLQQSNWYVLINTYLEQNVFCVHGHLIGIGIYFQKFSEMVDIYWKEALIVSGCPYGKKWKRFFFLSNAFFQLRLSIAKLFNELSLKCCLSVAYYTEALSYRDTLCFVYLSPYLRLGVFSSYLRDLFFHYQFYFQNN